MGKFLVKETKVSNKDTIEKFEKKVKEGALDMKTVGKLLEELDCKEGAWGYDRCCAIREYLEAYEPPVE